MIRSINIKLLKFNLVAMYLYVRAYVTRAYQQADVVRGRPLESGENPETPSTYGETHTHRHTTASIHTHTHTAKEGAQQPHNYKGEHYHEPTKHAVSYEEVKGETKRAQHSSGPDGACK